MAPVPTAWQGFCPAVAWQLTRVLSWAYYHVHAAHAQLVLQGGYNRKYRYHLHWIDAAPCKINIRAASSSYSNLLCLLTRRGGTASSSAAAGSGRKRAAASSAASEDAEGAKGHGGRRTRQGKGAEEASALAQEKWHEMALPPELDYSWRRRGELQLRCSVCEEHLPLR